MPQTMRLACLLLVALPACFKAIPHEGSVGTEDEVRHKSCAMPLPEELPESAGDAGTPLPALDCSNVTPLGACSDKISCTTVGTCITPDPNASGLCIDYAACSQGALPVGHQDGRCVTCMSAATRNALCCLHPTGVDCVGPSEKPRHDREVGELCHVHDDCARGLLCKRRNGNGWGLGFGRCLCPELDPAYVEDAVDCSPFSIPVQWGSDTPAKNVHCEAAPEQGFSVEVLTRQMDLLATAVDHVGRLHILHRTFVDSSGFALQGGPSLAEWVYDGSAWTLDLLPVTGDMTAIGLAFAPDGTMHALVAKAMGELLHVSNVSGAWVPRTLIPAGGHSIVDAAVALGADGRVNLAYLEENGGPLHHIILLDAEDSISHHVVAEADVTHLAAFLGGGDKLSFVYIRDKAPLLALTSFAAGNYVDSALHDGKWVSAALSSTDAFAYSYELAGTITMPVASQVRLVRGSSDENVWTLDDLHYERALPRAALAFDGTDAPWLAHRAPPGIVLEEPNGQSFTQHVLSPARSEQIQLVMDHKNAPHVFFLVKVAQDSTFELRHAFSGPCPKPK